MGGSDLSRDGSRRALQEIASHAQSVKPVLRRADRESQAKYRMDECHHVEISLAGVDGREGNSGEECDQSEAGIGQVSH